MRLLEFMFTDIWHFAGCFAILYLLVSMFRRPNVTNFYEFKAKAKNDYDETDKITEEQARADMWKRNV